MSIADSIDEKLVVTTYTICNLSTIELSFSLLLPQMYKHHCRYTGRKKSEIPDNQRMQQCHFK